LIRERDKAARLTDKEVTRLGRDPEGEVVIDADAAVVSRRHAEIRRSGDQFAITDLKSFNGTLVNNQRISEVGAVV
jgi:pSer/pThr/pTyr-binding forkhead associated (FHA) protein